MRKLNETETGIVTTLQSRRKLSADINVADIDVSYEILQERFTLAEALVHGRRVRGLSAYNRRDAKSGHPFNPELGERIAFSNALRSL